MSETSDQLNRSMFTIFCDDVRQEASGKLSFVGSYLQSMLVLEFPVQLPKFCAVMTVRTPVSQPFRTLLFKIVVDDKTVVELPIPESALSVPPGDDLNADLTYSFVAVAELSPFSINNPCIVKARAVADGVEIKGGTLPVHKGTIPVLVTRPSQT